VLGEGLVAAVGPEASYGVVSAVLEEVATLPASRQFRVAWPLIRAWSLHPMLDEQDRPEEDNNLRFEVEVSGNRSPGNDVLVRVSRLHEAVPEVSSGEHGVEWRFSWGDPWGRATRSPLWKWQDDVGYELWGTGGSQADPWLRAVEVTPFFEAAISAPVKSAMAFGG
jgi:hypothetical protein